MWVERVEAQEPGGNHRPRASTWGCEEATFQHVVCRALALNSNQVLSPFKL